MILQPSLEQNGRVLCRSLSYKRYRPAKLRIRASEAYHSGCIYSHREEGSALFLPTIWPRIGTKTGHSLSGGPDEQPAGFTHYFPAAFLTLIRSQDRLP